MKLPLWHCYGQCKLSHRNHIEENYDPFHKIGQRVISIGRVINFSNLKFGYSSKGADSSWLGKEQA